MSEQELRELLAEARAALGPEYFYLAGRIDDVLHPVEGETLSPRPRVANDLVIENYGDGFAWFRR
jgi:hypothetical protein